MAAMVEGDFHRQPVVHDFADSGSEDLTNNRLSRMYTSIPGDTDLHDLFQHLTTEGETIDDSLAEAAEDLNHDLYPEILEFVQERVHALPGFEELGDEQDFYAAGMDSLETVVLLRSLRKGLEIKYGSDRLRTLSTALVFSNPCIEKLTEAVIDCIQGNQVWNGSDVLSRTKNLDKVIEHYATELITTPASNSKTKQSHHHRKKMQHVVLTGSIRSLSQGLLRELSHVESVGKITCLDRSPSTRTKAGNSFSRIFGKGPKIVNLEASLDTDDFGLSEAETHSLSDVDVIIHNAWKVDLNQTLSSFEPLIAGVVNLTRFAAKLEHKPRIVFISSVGAIGNYRLGIAPEAVIEDSSVSGFSGFGQSKHAAERLLARAAEQSKLPITIIRVGQVAGEVKKSPPFKDNTSLHGCCKWSNTQWISLLLQTSKEMNCLPEELSLPVDWVPSNVSARVMSELIQYDVTSSKKDHGLTVYNITNPDVRPWSSLVPTVQASFHSDCAAVPYTEWLAMLETKRNAEGGDIEAAVAKFPALKLLYFFEELAHAERGFEKKALYHTKNSVKRSPTFSKLRPVNDEWIREWIEQWGL